MTYVFEYEIAALALEIVLVIVFAMRRNYPCGGTRMYLLILICSLFSSALNLVTIVTLAHIDTVPLWLNYLLNVAYLWAYNMCPMAFYLYVLRITHPKRVPLKLSAVAGVFIAVDTLLLITTPFTGWMINFDGGTYNHGILFPALYVTSICMIIFVGAALIAHRKELLGTQLSIIVVFALAMIGSIVIQAIWNELLIQNFVISLYLLIVYVSLQNPDDYFDKETMCFNRRAFYETAGRNIDRKQPFTMLAFTVDDFQYINRLVGSEACTQIIGDTAQFLRDRFGRNEVYHLEDNRFGMVLDGKDRNSAGAVAEEIRQHFALPVSVNGTEVQLTPYICSLDYPEFDIAVDEIRDALEYSVREMTRTREKNVIKVTSDALNEKRRETKVIHAMKSAIRHNSFDVYYQPIYSVREKKFISAEALIRLKDKELGFISPDEFIPLAERNGMITEIGEIVFRKVCDFLNSGEADGIGLQYIEVNLSAVQCMQENLSQRLTEIMKERSIPADRINFEITETARTMNEPVLRKNMTALIDEGSSFSMDDYGTGFSTANYLISLPMKIVKIDKSILWPAMENEDAFTILRHTVSMLRSLNKEIVVEGVETEKMAQLLSEMGCDFLQGYLYSKPIPKDDFVAFMKAHVVTE